MKTPDEYGRIARIADDATEKILFECTKGNRGMFDRTLYEVVFPIVLQDLLKEN